MANFLLLVDSDAQRRTRCAQRAAAQLAPVERLLAGSISVGDFTAMWVAEPRVPVSAMADEDTAAVVWGDAITTASEWIDAAGLAAAWYPQAGASPPPFDGFHAALRFDVRDGLRVGADLLGLFPVYYATADGVLIAGSSPQLFRLHPLFPPRLSLEGLVGILLLHAPFAGQTLLRGVRRLAPGRMLVWQPGREVEEVRNYAIPISTRLHGLPFGEHVALLDRAFADATARHAPPQTPHGILLSGGRDSRLLAGYLACQGTEVQALTLGQPGDHDARCAVGVARALGFPQTLASIQPSQFPRAAERQARWEHLATGFSNLHMWEAIEPLRELPSRLVTGYLREVREIPRMPAPFATFFPQVSRHAIAPERLKQLLRPPVFNGLIEEMLQRIEAAYQRCSPLEAQRPWRFLLAHDWRFHAGGVPWKLSFGAWPVLPVLDRSVLEVIALLPDSSLADRRAQDEILRTRFPALARLPLDRNSDDTTPLLTPLHRHVARQLGRLTGPLRSRNGGKGGVERRYYHRIYDLNSPGWQAVRRGAEPHRERLADLFQMDELARYLPPPGDHVHLEHGILDGYGRKLLLGLMLWSQQNLP